MFVNRSLLALSILLIHGLVAPTVAEESSAEVDLSRVYITGGADESKRQPGSAVLIDDVALKQFEYSDIHRVLNQVPGMNIQEEDGYGLRPNIGIRGTAAERSKKVTLMEDGVLSGPAPYSAPAAYYFPNVSRMSGVEVFKGPATIQYGPATVAGALNMVSRPVPELLTGGIDIQYGQDNFQKYHGHVGDQIDAGYGSAGWLIDGLRISSDGFKDIDNSNENSGFTRNDVNLKTQWQKFGEISHLVQLKFGYADETSNETYVGLTKKDLNDDPFRRYAATQLDETDWTHESSQLTYQIELSNGTTVTTDAYYRTFERDWFKFNRLGSTDVTAAEVLKAPNANADNQALYQVLTGQKDSANESEQLHIGNNGREYVSQGVQARVNHTFEFESFSNEIELGIRYHQDEVEREHTEQAYEMRSGRLETTSGSLVELRTSNKGEAEAVSVYLRDQLIVGDTTVTAGVRSEQIKTTLTDNLNYIVTERDESILLPGIGVYSQLTDTLGVLAGVHKGFISTAPGQTGDAEPEQSINYEAGVRINGKTEFELIGFYNDYSNLTGTCTFNNGCANDDIDSEASAGEASVYGAELSWKTGGYVGGYLVPINVTYTYTKTQFDNSFTDSTGVFGDKGADVKSGFEMAYVPEHRLNYQLTFGTEVWQSGFSLLYQSAMRDTPGEGKIDAEDKIAGYVVVDWSFDYQVMDSLKLYSTVDNLFDRQYVVSAQPIGYRPSKPRRLNVGVKYDF